MIEAVKSTTIIYTDHSVTIFIVQQTSLNIMTMKKLNLRLVCVLEYLQCFCLNIHYKSKKTNTISNILFRLTSQVC